MKTRSSKTLHSKLQRSKIRPLCLPYNRTAQNWRAKKVTVRVLPMYRVQITFRRFRTQPKNRSKKYSQTVLRLHIFHIREIAISFKVAGKRRSSTFTTRVKKVPTKQRISYALLGFGLFGIAFFSWQLVANFTRRPPAVLAESTLSVINSTPTAQSTEYKGLGRSEPTNIQIESLTIDYRVFPVGQNPDGTIETPDIFDNRVGWYKFGPTPGEVGPAVLVGHVDTYKGPSVFWRLSQAIPGEIIRITRQDGSVATFTITKVAQYGQNDFPTMEIYGNTELPEVRLITCGGAFNYLTMKYSKNTVVYGTYIDAL